MLMDRIVGAFTFRREVYADVEKDASFTQTAWMIVVVVSLLTSLGTFAGGEFGRWIVGAIGGTIFNVVGFAVGAFVISWAGKQFFNADVSFEEMVRTLGLAYVWRAVGVLGILGFLGPLSCLLAPVQFLALIAGFVAWAFAAKEALDLEWPQTIVTVLIAWVIIFVINLIWTGILGLLGFAGSVASGALGG